MKSIVRILSLILAISCLICLFVSCNDKDENQDENPTPEVEYVDYTVCVVDDYGNPMTDVMVRFVNEDGEIKSRLTFEDGIATYKNAVAGKYIVLLEKGNSNAIFTQTEYQLTKANNTLTVVVRNEKKTTDIYGDAVDEDDYAHNIAEGEHKINGKAGETSYFLLKVFLSGKYKISFKSEDNGMTVGYYGNPMFVQTTHRGEGEYDGKSFEIDIHDILAPYIIGLNFTTDCEATLVVERVGDTTFDPNFDIPVVSVDTSKTNLPQINLTDEVVPVDIDITDSNLSYYVGDDGYYYTSDGKLIYLRFTTTGNHDNMEIPLPSLKEMLALGSDPDAMVTIGGINFGGFVYDENGNYIEKRIYNDMLESYYEVCDGRYGLYVLTTELAEAIRVHGDNSGWWDMDNPNTCIFNSDVNENIAWMFFCCTLEAK